MLRFKCHLFPGKDLRKHVRLFSSLPTIYALSTAPGRAAIGVVRVSGSHSKYIFQQLANTKSTPKHRISSLRKLHNPLNNSTIDEALTLFFEGPKSYTGEDLLEVHVHGGTAVIDALLRAIGQLHTPEREIRYAEAGEFSRRAFQNGKFDLTEIEGIREVIDAETELQRAAAMESAGGANKRLFNSWRDFILNQTAELTNKIDFEEDEETENPDFWITLNENVSLVEKEMKAYIKRAKNSELLLKGTQICLIGPPNAGKSTLLNALAGKDVAIVSDIPGTTRDVINLPLNFNGFKIVLGDTAGLRKVNMSDPIEAEGIKRAKSKSLNSDITVVVLPLDTPVITEDIRDHIDYLVSNEKSVLVILNKCDLVNLIEKEKELLDYYSRYLKLPVEAFNFVSSINGSGITPEFTNKLTDKIKIATNTGLDETVSVSQRALDILQHDVLLGLEEYKEHMRSGGVVLAAESLKRSVEGIGKVTGQAMGLEEILSVVFSKFCIGK